jgi:hypothetical protein
MNAGSMSATSSVAGPSTAALVELAPLLRRAQTLDPASIVRIRIQVDAASALVRLPFGVLVGRRIAGSFAPLHDGSYRTDELVAWLDNTAAAGSVAAGFAAAGSAPATHDDAWRGSLPPETGWRRVETVPDDVARGLVRSGALTLKDAAEREGHPGAQPRAEVADSLLDSIVLTASTADDRVEVSLRLLSALVRMGFLARDSHLAIDRAGRWVRLAASYGSAYAERESLGLGLARPNPDRGIGR